MIKFGIVEDISEVREYVAECITSDERFVCVFSCESVEEVLNSLDSDDLPAFILMDINLPGMSGISGVKLIKQKYPEIDLVMLTNYDESGKIFESLQAGASGYLLKSTSFDDIHDAIGLLLNGGAPMSPVVARKVLEFFRPQKKKSEDSNLTDREKQVVEGLVDGLSYKMIADRLKISPGTIFTHIKNIYKKLHVNSKGEVISKSLKGEI
ncbi:MAG: response regulator transcription factor [Candidatus Delongbacteria bacterium]|nr:response regulator transcription factor [Candidatus Delongbacteria bacterium]